MQSNRQNLEELREHQWCVQQSQAIDDCFEQTYK